MPPQTPLLRPHRFFAERDRSFARVAAVFGVLVLAGPATVYGVGWVLAGAVDGTVAVDNPERPPDWLCDDGGGAGTGTGTDSESPLYDDEACSAPETVDVDVDSLLWDAVEDAAGPAALAYPLVVAATWLPLHVGVRLAGGERGPVRTLVVGVWGLLPSVLATPLLLVALAVALDPITVESSSAASLAALTGTVESAVADVRPVPAVALAVTTLWGGVVWGVGLVHEQGLDRAAAAVVAGFVAVASAVVALA